MHQLEDFFDPCTGVSKCLNKRPSPEGVVLFEGQVPVLSIAPNPDMRMFTALEDFPSLAVHVDSLAGAGRRGIRQGCFCCAEGLFGSLHQTGQHGSQFTGALLHRCDGGAPVLHITAGFGGCRRPRADPRPSLPRRCGLPGPGSRRSPSRRNAARSRPCIRARCHARTVQVRRDIAGPFAPGDLGDHRPLSSSRTEPSSSRAASRFRPISSVPGAGAHSGPPNRCGDPKKNEGRRTIH